MFYCSANSETRTKQQLCGAFCGSLCKTIKFAVRSPILFGRLGCVTLNTRGEGKIHNRVWQHSQLELLKVRPRPMRVEETINNLKGKKQSLAQYKMQCVLLSRDNLFSQ